MTIDYHIIVGKELSRPEKKSVESIVKSVFSKVDTCFNDWNPESEVSQLNRLKANDTVKLSSAMHSFLCHIDAAVKLTGGLYDPTIQPLYKLWKQKLQSGAIPTPDQIKSLLPAVGWEKIHFEDGLFFKDHDATAMDFGGSAKGHCVDLLVESLSSAGWSDLYVEWGGEVRTIGWHPCFRPWRVYIRGFENSDVSNGIAIVELKDMALATSGDYLQNWSVKIDGKRVAYSHIIDPRSNSPRLMSNHSIASASIMVPNCALADSIATAAMLFENPQEGEVWLKQLEMRLPLGGYWLVSRKEVCKRN